MAEHIIYVEGEDFAELEIVVDYNVWGKHRPATHYEPAEQPEVEVECFRLKGGLAALLGVDEVLDFARVEELIDMDKLHEDLLDNYEPDEPDYDYHMDFEDSYKW